jgi:hypothetical protein
MKVTIIQRSVYHKIAEVEIEVPNDVDDVQQYLVCNEHLYTDKIDEAMSETSLGYGHGMIDGMTDWKEESEWRYECEGIGGHL